MAIKEVDIPELLDDYDWKQVFGEPGSEYGQILQDCPPGAVVDITTPVRRTDVQEILAAVNGENDGAEWLGVFFLKDGRYLVGSGGCDYTGWDCQGSNCTLVCSSFNDVMLFGLTDQQKKRLGLDGDTHESQAKAV